MNYRFWVRVASPLVRMIWPVEILNKEKFVNKKAVYICNHYTVMDMNNISVQLLRDKMNVVVKEEAFANPIAARFLKGCGCIPIHRGEADMRAIKNIMGVLKSDEPLFIFPEGKRNRSGSKEMLEFKDGAVVFAIKSKAPLIPVMYYSPPRIFRKTYLIIGDEIDLTDLYGKSLSEVKAEGAERARKAMLDLREKLDSIVEDKKKLKYVRKNTKEAIKQAKVAARLAKKESRKAKRKAVAVKAENIEDGNQSS